MEEKNTVPAAIPPAGTEDIPTRKDRRPIIIAVAAVAAAVLIAGGVCGYRVYEHHRVSLARQACASAVADQSKAVRQFQVQQPIILSGWSVIRHVYKEFLIRLFTEHAVAHTERNMLPIILIADIRQNQFDVT